MISTVWPQRGTDIKFEPSGRPLILYSLPELHGTHSYLCPVSKEEMDVYSKDCTFRKSIQCDEDVFEMCSIFVAENNFAFPSTADKAVVLYMELRQIAQPFVDT